MAKHEFGIMNTALKPNERYDTFEPEKYECISVHDDYIEPLLDRLATVDCYWHTIERPERGLSYCGINLIPPASMGRLIELLENTAGTEALRALLRKAEKEGKFVIHFGI